MRRHENDPSRFPKVKEGAEEILKEAEVIARNMKNQYRWIV